MFIAFEGPDNVGKSTSAQALDAAGQPVYQASKEKHAQRVKDTRDDSGEDHLMPWTYDRIDWFSHLVYRLALPGAEWNDAAVRTVFAMPDTHLVVKIHRPDLANFTEERPASHTGQVTPTNVAEVNPVYWAVTDMLMRLNEFKGFTLFKSISIIEVVNTPDGYAQYMMAHSSAAYGDAADQVLTRMVTSDTDLLTFLQDVEQRTL